MKKALIAIITVIVLAGISFFLYSRGTTPAPEGVPAPTAEVSNLVFKGEVIELDAEQAKVDGPYIFVIREQDGNEVVLAVPARFGICAAGTNVAEPSGIRVGMTVEVGGALTFEGNIVPCESPDHYLRVVSKK